MVNVYISGRLDIVENGMVGKGIRSTCLAG